MFKFKKIKVNNGEKIDIKAYEKFEVRWLANKSFGEGTEQVEIFPEQQTALKFFNEIKEAHILLRNRYDTNIKLINDKNNVIKSWGYKG